MRGLGVMTYEIEGGERLQRDGLLVLANHPTIDVVCLISLLPNADCVVKRAVACNPFMRGPVRAAGYLNDDGAGLVDDCGRSARWAPWSSSRKAPAACRGGHRGCSAGRQHRRTGPHRRHPVRITCSPPTLTKGQKWYRVPSRRFHVRLQIGEDIPIAPFLAEDDSPRGMPWRPVTSPSTFLVISTCLEVRTVQARARDQGIDHFLPFAGGHHAGGHRSDRAAVRRGPRLDSIDALELGLALQKKYGVSLSADSEETSPFLQRARARRVRRRPPVVTAPELP